MKIRKNGFTIIEVLLAVAILAIAGFAVARFVITSKRISSKISDSSECTNAANSILAEISNQGSNLDIFPPYFPSGTDRTGSDLQIPSGFSKFGLEVMNPSSIVIVGRDSGPLTIGNSLLLKNSTNLVQALYNSDPISSCVDEGGSSFGLSIANNFAIQGLENLKIYLNIQPLDIESGVIRPCPGSALLSRPLRNSVQPPQISASALNFLGDQTLGFKTTVTIEYQEKTQKRYCQASGQYSHQADLSVLQRLPAPVAIRNGDGVDLTGRSFVSCSTDGSKYRDVEVDFSFPTTGTGPKVEKGSVMICRGKASVPPGSFPLNTNWTACDAFQFAGYQANPTQILNLKLPSPNPGGDQQLEYTMKFFELTGDMKYDLEYAFVDSAGNVSPVTSLSFYVDSTPPTISSIRATSNIGIPGDNRAGGNYSGPDANWSEPSPQFSNGKWLQCNANSSSMTATVSDRIGIGMGCTNVTIQNSKSQNVLASGATDCVIRTISGMPNSENTVSVTAVDICSTGGSASATWHVDL
ncbi:MAG: type II secretion system protein, partial [Bdellovibrionales bacterium]|nr:type II secretion system protein [Bdellovibrionales bacterium]